MYQEYTYYVKGKMANNAHFSSRTFADGGKHCCIMTSYLPTFLLFFADSEESLGPAKLTNEVLQIMEKIPDTVTAMTGHKVRSALT